MAAHGSIPSVTEDLTPDTSERLTRPFARFASLSSSGGLVLLGTTVLALVWANSIFGHTYHHIFHEIMFAIGLAGEPVTVGTSAAWEGGVVGKNYNLHWWINDFLMAIFFLLVGLEIKREIMVGELSDVKKATLPVIAALGGMVGPALIYAALNMGSGGQIHGWGVPMATDIAFALGILALIGSRAPTSLKVFLTSLAIADDLGALLVIALFYTEKLNMTALGISGAILAVLIAINLLGFRRSLWYLIPGLVLWYFVYESGIHATIAGVLLAATIPAKSRVDSDRYLKYTRSALDAFEDHSTPGTNVESNSDQRAAVYAVQENGKFILPLLHRMEHGLHPWVAFFIIPVFALANAGVHIGSDFFEGGVGGFFGVIFGDPIMLGIILGLVVGKPLGIALFSFLGVKAGVASLPRGVSWRHILGAGCLGGIGFTMAIFIANLAFKNPPAPGNLATSEEARVAYEAAVALAGEHRDHATIGILIASTISTLLGLGLLLTCREQPEPEPDELGPEIDTRS